MFAVSIVLAGAAGRAHAAEQPRMKISATMDFLDHCYEETDPAVGYFTEAQLENVFVSLKAIGVTKINYRVNACGLQHYNTTHGKKFAGDGRVGCDNLARTLAKYDPCKLSTELGKKYGIEVFAWDSLGDDNAVSLFYERGNTSKMPLTNEPLVDTQDNLATKYGIYPLLDPYYLKNRAASMAIDPKVVRKEIQLQNTDLPATKIVIQSYYKNQSPRAISKEDFSIFVSDDNAKYRHYVGDYSFAVESTAPVRLVLDGLNIPEKYVCFVWKKPMGEQFTMALKGSAMRSGAKVYSHDKEITTAWTYTNANHPTDAEALLSLSFGSVTFDSEMGDVDGRNYAWDYRNVCIGYAKGLPTMLTSPEYREMTRGRILAMPEYANQGLLEYKVAKFADLAAYDWGGFTLNLRSHNPIADRAGYGQENRDKFLARHGVDVFKTDDFDKKAWNDLRAEAVDEFLRQAKRVAKDRPVYMNVPKRHEDGYAYLGVWGDLRWHPEVWLKDKSVDGLCALFWDADQPLADLAAQTYKGAKIIQFYQINDGPTPEKFKQDLIKYRDAGFVDELEIYQTTVILKNLEGKYAEILREFTGNTK
jgi:hypothetical protein